MKRQKEFPDARRILTPEEARRGRPPELEPVLGALEAAGAISRPAALLARLPPEIAARVVALVGASYSVSMAWMLGDTSSSTALAKASRGALAELHGAALRGFEGKDKLPGRHEFAAQFCVIATKSGLLDSLDEHAAKCSGGACSCRLGDEPATAPGAPAIEVKHLDCSCPVCAALGTEH